MLLAALAPALTHALARDGTAVWAQICTATGSKTVRVDGGSAAEAGDLSPDAAKPLLDHCPGCSLQGPAADLPPAQAWGLVPPAPARALPVLYLHAPRTLFAWAAAQPRGPPSQS